MSNLLHLLFSILIQVHFDKITSRISKLCYGLNLDFIDPPRVSQKVFLFFATENFFSLPPA